MHPLSIGTFPYLSYSLTGTVIQGFQESYLRVIQDLYSISHFESPWKHGKVMERRERKVDNRIRRDKPFWITAILNKK